MDVRWKKYGNDEEILRHRNSFEFLTEVLTSEFKKKEAVRDYSQGWEARQIAVNEYNQALSDLLVFIKLKKD